MTKQQFSTAGRSYAMLVALVGLLVAAAAGAAPTRATSRLVTPRTLFIEQGTIHKFTQDGDRISWVGWTPLRRPPAWRVRSGAVGC